MHQSSLGGPTGGPKASVALLGLDKQLSGSVQYLTESVLLRSAMARENGGHAGEFVATWT